MRWAWYKGYIGTIRKSLGWHPGTLAGWLPGASVGSQGSYLEFAYMYICMYICMNGDCKGLWWKMVSRPCSQAPWCGAPHSKVVYIPHFPILWSKYNSPFYEAIIIPHSMKQIYFHILWSNLQKVPNQLFHTTPSHRPPFYFFIKAWVPAQTRASQWVSMIYCITINSGTKMVFYCSIIASSLRWLKL